MIFQYAGRVTARFAVAQSGAHANRVALAQLGAARVNVVANPTLPSFLSFLGPSASHACAEGQRGYATAPSQAPKTKSTTKRAPAKPATKRATTKAGAKKTGAKKAGAKKTKAKGAKGKKPLKAKAPRKKKEPTAEQKLAAEKKKKNATIRELRKAALVAPRAKPATAYTVMVTEFVKQDSGKPVTERFKEAAVRYKSLSAEEKEHYNHFANQNREANEKQREAWVASLSPSQIHEANNARMRLRKMGKKSSYKIKDPRLVKRPVTARNVFTKERHVSGDLKGIKLAEASKLIDKEWKELTAAQKKPYYEDEVKARQQYVRDVKNVYGRDISLASDTTASRALSASP